MSATEQRRATLEAAVQLGLTPDEYAKICEIQGGEPTYVELAIYSLMWSEHCSYKHSRPILGRFPTSGPRILQGPGENAGIIDVGDGWAVAMKVESHNHPSAVEPFQGAATGVGGIVRDIFTMGARPCVSLDSLRFGEIEGDDNARQRFLFDGVVGGIGFYGNCLGIPTVGGEVYFEDTYAGNCLVNAMSAGLLRTDQIVRAIASGPGNHVVLIGSKTGRDGIGGASVLASQEFDETLEEKRPSVQVGDPFTEKKLIEACLELLHGHLVVSMQDLGAAGLTSSSSEMASKGRVGLDIHADRIPLREADMEPWEIMVSESQERMLCIVEPGQIDAVREVCDRWDLDCTIIGEVTDSKMLRIYWHGERVADIPARRLADESPVIRTPSFKPAYLVDEPVAVDDAAYPPAADAGAALLELLAAIRSQEETIRQGGGAKAAAAQHAKKRLTVRERLDLLLDK
ncbi:MAG TPA: phosphoribosylformylglycinamidine synthase subunit PurL, partial [Thermoleophilia bacterium]|nr:phosphoribosylformylglycinamidine synthase subunit PurL [Thermoleophilia bacterium]